jgi:methylenetetrahydrofolate reductase (NADPH)
VIVSLEIVPRDYEALSAGSAVAENFPVISVINVPDLLRFPIRSWDAVEVLRKNRPALRYIPHIRAQDFDLHTPFPLGAVFSERGITEVLVIAGDTPKTAPAYPTQTLPFIRKLHSELPALRIYTAFDPYRSNIRYELDYLQEKEAAGSCGFFSQPFFDLRLLELYAEYLEGKTVFWGIAPVLSASSRQYWESRNRALFPQKFRPDMAWNRDFGHQVMRFCESCAFNLYLMPINVDLVGYLTGLFSYSPLERCSW